MTYQEMCDVIQLNNGCKFIVQYKDGTTDKKKLFISTIGNICEFIPNSRTKGVSICVNNIDDIIVDDKKIKVGVELCRENLDKVIKYLIGSGFWKPMLRGAQFMMSLSDNELEDMRHWDNYHTIWQNRADKGMLWFGYDCFLNLFTKKVKAMSFPKWDKEYELERISHAILHHENICHSWRHRYDNSYEINFDGDYPKAWYSEEYKGCLNGYYYFLLDKNHVLFSEKD